jgi:Flp pilus assembly protein TadG
MDALKRLKREEGQVLVWALILLPVLMLLVGMLFEGGMMYRTYRAAQMAADSAAHAAAQEMDPGTYLRTGRVVLSDGATGVAQSYAARNSRGAVTCGQPQVWAQRVQVGCTATLRPAFIRVVPEIHVAVVGRARPAWGVTREHE